MRRAFVGIHRWTGLTVGVLLVFVALTGAATAYRSLFETTVERDLLVVSSSAHREPLDAIVSAARAAHPSGSLDQVRVFPHDATADHDRSVQLRFRDQGLVDVVYVDPSNARVITIRPRWSGLFATLEQLHRFRFVPALDGVSGVVALGFIVVIAPLGLYLWWPRGARTMRRAVRFNPRASGRARLVDQHRVIGLYALVIVMASAVTGVPQAFDWGEALLYRITSSRPDPKPKLVDATARARASFATLLDHASQRANDPIDVTLRMPSKAGQPVVATILERSAPHAEAKSIAYLEPGDGALLRYVPYAERSAGDRLHAWTLAWHTGELFGAVGPITLTLGALGVTFLFYSGLASYLARRRTAASS